MQTAAGLIKLKPESGRHIEEWKTTLKTRRDEALCTLRGEGVTIESWFELEIDGQHYLLWYMRADDIERAWQVAQQSPHQIDAYHFKIMSTITDARIQAVPLLDLSSEFDDHRT